MSKAFKRDAVTRFDVGENDRILLDGKEYRFEQYYSGGVALRSCEDSAITTLPWSDLDNRVRLRRLKIEKDYHSLSNAIARAETEAAAKGPSKLPADVVLRSVMVRAFLEAEKDDDNDVMVRRSPKKVAAFIERFVLENEALVKEARKAREGTASEKYVIVGPRQFCRHLEKFEKSSGNDRSLERKNQGRTYLGSRFTDTQLDFFQEHVRLFLNEDEPSVSAAFVKMTVRANEDEKQGKPVVKLCSASTFARLVKDQGDYKVELARSKDKYRTRRKFQISARGLEPKYPMHIIEMDEKLLDVMTVCKNFKIWELLDEQVQKRVEEIGRAWFSVALDAYSRSACGMRILEGEPNSAEAIATLAMAVRNKNVATTYAQAQSGWPQCGTPDAVHTDAGTGYTSADFEWTVIQLTKRKRIPPSKHPHLRGRVERFFRTLRTRFDHNFSGQTFSNVLMKGRYKPEEHAHLTHTELCTLLVRFILDVYHNMPMRSMNNETPLDRWYRGSQQERPVPPPPTDDEYRDIFGVWLHRKIGNRGITILGNTYWSEHLQNVREWDYRVKLNIRISDQDVSSVSFQDPRDNKWYTAKATFPGLEGVTIAEWQETILHIARHWGNRAAKSESAREIVLSTLSEIQKVADLSRLAAGVGSPLHSEETIKRFEREKMAAFSYAYWLRTDFGDDPDDDEDLGPKIEADADEAAAPPVPTSSTSDEDPFDPQGEYSQADLVEPGRLPRKKGVARKSPQRPRPEDHADAVDDDDLPLPRAVLEIEDEDGTDD